MVSVAGTAVGSALLPPLRVYDNPRPRKVIVLVSLAGGFLPKALCIELQPLTLAKV